MNDIHTKKTSDRKRKEDDFVTDFQKKCISNISVLCAKKNHSAGKKKIFGYITKGFCFVSVMSLALRLVLKYIYNKDVHIYTVISLLSAVISIVSGQISVNEAEKEDVFSREIKFFEEAINSSESI